MSRRLTSYVHVVDSDGRDVAFGPGDKVPGWAAKQIVNPKAWADPNADDDETSTSGASGSSTVPAGAGTGNADDGEPPRAGAGSGKEAWAEYAEALGISVPADAKRDDIVVLVDEHKTAAGDGGS